MSAFTDFVQLELPKRPYLDTDVSTESIIVRRGAGPRQLQGISLNEGEVLGNSGGTLQGIAISSGLRFTQSSASNTWVLTHGRNSKNVVVQVFDDNDDLVTPDNIRTNLDNVTVTFGISFTGYANVLFFS